MPAQKTERSVDALMGMILCNELQIPEIKRGYKWPPRRAAELISWLYHGHPTEQLLFWRPDEAVRRRPFSIGRVPSEPISDRVYLIDGEQRLTALYRVLNDHPEAQVVFNLETEEFRIQSAATTAENWVKVFDVTQPNANHYALVERMCRASQGLSKNEIAERLLRVTGIRYRDYDIKILTDISYEDVATICGRNQGGEPWTSDERMIAMLAIRWPGIVDTLQAEATHWKSEDYDNIDEIFLARALIAVTHGNLSAWSQASVEASSSQNLQRNWRTVQRGIRHLVPLLRNNLKITHSSLLPSMLVLLPLIVFLGERPDERMDEETWNSILYWLLVATIRKRYTRITDDELSQDIATVRGPSPAWGLHNNLGTIETRVKVNAKNISAPHQSNPYSLLSFLIARTKGAGDWWYGIEVAAGGDAGQRLEAHHIHPQATLTAHAKAYSRAEIDDLANIAFISGRANRNIRDRLPADYFPTISENELLAHFIPLGADLRHPDNFRGFLSMRQRILARAMTEYLNRYRPSWLDAGRPETPSPSSVLKFIRYKAKWDLGKIVAEGEHDGRGWSAVVAVPNLLAVLDAAAEEIEGDGPEDQDPDEEMAINIGGQNIPVHLEDDMVDIRFGPFLVTGTVEEWRHAVERRRSRTRPLTEFLEITTLPWDGDPIPFPVTRIS
jgi:hypothetical protein